MTNIILYVPAHNFYSTTQKDIARGGEMEIADKFTEYNSTKNEKGSKELLFDASPQSHKASIQ
jgi:hypothetical protein